METFLPTTTIIQSLYLVLQLAQHGGRSGQGRQKGTLFSSIDSGTLRGNQVDLSKPPQL